MAPEPIKDFVYYDGQNHVHADRWPIYREIMRRTGGKPNDLHNKIASVRPDTTDTEKILEANEAAEQLEALVRDVFKMQPFNSATGQGARWEHCLAAWKAFRAVMAEEKKNTVTSPTISAPTAAPDSSQPTPSTSVSS